MHELQSESKWHITARECKDSNCSSCMGRQRCHCRKVEPTESPRSHGAKLGRLTKVCSSKLELHISPEALQHQPARKLGTLLWSHGAFDVLNQLETFSLRPSAKASSRFSMDSSCGSWSAPRSNSINRKGKVDCYLEITCFLRKAEQLPPLGGVWNGKWTDGGLALDHRIRIQF